MVKVQNVVWVKTPCSLADGCQCFKEHTSSINSLSEEVGSMCLWNINFILLVYSGNIRGRDH